MAEWRAYTPEPLYPSDYAAFIKWYKRIYGKDAPVPPNDSTIRELSAYQAFMVQGSPGVKLTEPAWQDIARWEPPTPLAEPEKALTPNEQKAMELVDLEIEKLKGEIASGKKPSAAEMQLKTSYAQQENIRLQHLLSPQIDFRRTDQERADIFEQARQSILQTATSPADWIARWQAENAPNPYVEPPLTNQEELERVQSEKAYWEGLASPAIAKDFTGSGAPRITPLQQKAAAVGQIGAEGAAANIAMWQDIIAREGAGGVPQPVQPGGPPAPAWLPGFVPGQVAGQPISRLPIQTPSGQQLARTPSSVLQGLSGYAEWYGGRPLTDILEYAASMQPQDPKLGRPRWTPPR